MFEGPLCTRKSPSLCTTQVTFLLPSNLPPPLFFKPKSWLYIAAGPPAPMQEELQTPGRTKSEHRKTEKIPAPDLFSLTLQSGGTWNQDLYQAQSLIDFQALLP